MTKVEIRCMNNAGNNTGQCLCCGQCCSSFYVKMSHKELTKQALKDEAKGLSILESDAKFIIKHGIRLSVEEAEMRSPALLNSPNWPRDEYWTCQFHRNDGLCDLDILQLPKPHVCTGYPWYDREPRLKWLYPGCGYNADLFGLKLVKQKEETIMSLPDELEVKVAEVVDYTKMNGSFALALQEVVKRKVAVAEAKKRGLVVSDEELQKAADIFRQVNSLTTSSVTLTWLEERGLTLGALEDHLESNLLIYELKNLLALEFDKERYFTLQPIQDSIRETAYQDWLTNMIG